MPGILKQQCNGVFLVVEDEGYDENDGNDDEEDVEGDV